MENGLRLGSSAQTERWQYLQVVEWGACGGESMYVVAFLIPEGVGFVSQSSLFQVVVVGVVVLCYIGRAHV